MKRADSKAPESHPSRAAANSTTGRNCLSALPARYGFNIQPKLTINQPNDAYEQEADRMADQVMRMSSPVIQTKPLTISSVQRKCAHCEEEESRMQRKERNGADVTSTNELESYVGNLNSGGEALSSEVRRFYEPRFGYDFGDVRIHKDIVAAKSAQSINAQAYTSGNNIVFNSGQYSPDTDSGKRLLGHELTHVVQQRGNTIQPHALGPVEEKEQIPGMVSGIKGRAGSMIQRQIESKGDVGCPVAEIQEKLNINGESLVVDGHFGRLTEAAVKRFQTANGLVPDGDVGPLTRAQLLTVVPGNNHGLPTGETTTSNGWDAGGLHKWRQRLTPFTTSFKGCQVTEADTGGGTDTCHFPGSAFAPFTAVTGGTWDVDANNRWGDDFVGWFTAAVNFYRSNGRAPCRATFPQSMRVVKPGGDVEYKHHQLSAEIGVTTVSSTRDTETETRVFP